MTEEEWLTSDDLETMLDYLGGTVNDRKSRLYGCACCRHIWLLMIDERSRQAVEIAEQFIDGVIGRDELEEARIEARSAARDVTGSNYPSHERGVMKNASEAAAGVVGKRVSKVIGAVAKSVVVAAAENAGVIGSRVGAYETYRSAEIKSSSKQLAGTLRDVFGNPFRPVAVDAEWLTSTVVQLARGIYEERAFDRMPILADALQDAGCVNHDVLSHCRDESATHVRGCWVVDLLLGKT